MNKKHPDDKLAQSTTYISLSFILRLVAFIGKPFYFILFVIAFSVYITGYFFRTVASNGLQYFISLLLTITTGIPKEVASRIRNISLFKNADRTINFIAKSLTLIILRIFHSATNLLIQTAAMVAKQFSDIIPKLTKTIASFINHHKDKMYSFIKNKINNIYVAESSIGLKRMPKRLFLRAGLYVLFAKKLIQKLTHHATDEEIISVIKPIKSFRFRLFVLIALFALTVVASTGYFFWIYIFKDLPSADELVSRKQVVSTKIYDRNKILLYTIYKDFNRSPIPLSQIPIQVQLSTLAIEDAEFYNHPGFSIRGIARALYKNIKKRQLTGGSTITQQLVKNTLLSPEKTVTRKLKEVVLAIRVEKTFSKDQILEMYLNEVGYGSTAYGIKEGARLYFGKDVNNLTLAEAAILAGIPKSPTQYSPFGVHPENAQLRQKEVLNLMEINGYITEQQKLQAEAEEIKYVQNKTDIKAPHFVMHVKSLLEEKYGTQVVEQGGLEVITSLDYEIQKLAEKVISTEVDKLAKLNVTNGATVVLNPQTGEILAMVGSKDFFDQENDGNVNVTTSLRQPGSSIKIVNYAYALSHGYTPASIIDDSPVTFMIPNQEPYTPKNYEGGYRGKLSLRSAFAQSRNIPAVRVLNSFGVKNMIDLGQKMGISSWTNPQNYGLSLTLGGGDVKLLDLAYVFATVANYGKKPDQVAVIKVTTHDGSVLEEFNCLDDKRDFAEIANATSSALAFNPHAKCDQKEILKPGVAFLITDILKDNAARTPAFGANSQLVIPRHPEVAVKTGTSNNLRDNLTIGYNQGYVVAVWVGNNNNSPMNRIASGVTGASPIFNQIMSALLASTEAQEWIAPPGTVQLPICQYTGTLSCTGCPIKMEWFLEENKPTYACKSEQIDQIVNASKRPQILDEAWRSDD